MNNYFVCTLSVAFILMLSRGLLELSRVLDEKAGLRVDRSDYTLLGVVRTIIREYKKEKEYRKKMKKAGKKS